MKKWRNDFVFLRVLGFLLLCKYNFFGWSPSVSKEWKVFHGLLLVCWGKHVLFLVSSQLNFFSSCYENGLLVQVLTLQLHCRGHWHGHWLYGVVAWCLVLLTNLLVSSYIFYQVSIYTFGMPDLLSPQSCIQVHLLYLMFGNWKLQNASLLYFLYHCCIT